MKYIDPKFQKHLDDQKVSRWLQTQRAFLGYFVLVQVVAMAVCLIGMLTEHWYAFEQSSGLTSIAGNEVLYEQQWNMGTQTLSVKTMYCDAVGCSLDKEQKLYFDPADGADCAECILFPDTFQPSIDTLLTGRMVMTYCVSGALVGITTTFTLMLYVYYLLWLKNPSLTKLKLVTFVACAIAIGSSALGLKGVAIFKHQSKEFREFLELNSWIPYTEPSLKLLGWSAWLTAASMILSGGGFIVTFLSYRFVTSSVEVDPAIIAERNARVKGYFADVTNTTYITESTSVDTLNEKAIKNGGWTETVRAKVQNIPQNKNWRELGQIEGDLNVEDLDGMEMGAMPGIGEQLCTVAGGFQQQRKPGIKVGEHLPQPPVKNPVLAAASRRKAIQAADADGIPTVFHERKRQVTRAPPPARAPRPVKATVAGITDPNAGKYKVNIGGKG